MTLIDAKPVADHIATLREAGATIGRIATLALRPSLTVKAISEGQPTCQQAVADDILGIDPNRPDLLPPRRGGWATPKPPKPAKRTRHECDPDSPPELVDGVWRTVGHVQQWIPKPVPDDSIDRCKKCGQPRRTDPS